VSTTILAYIILSETPTPVRIVGAVIILTGIAMASLHPTNSIR
jgi:drug/metabolite transporter (DMT)-like permease